MFFFPEPCMSLLYFFSNLPEFIRSDCVLTLIILALQYVLSQKKRITRCDSIAPYSEFLGLHVTSGVHKKTQELGNFVSDPLLLHYYLNVPSGHQKLAELLKAQGMSLAKDGGITINHTLSKKNDR